jgi:hypothetical protein
MELPLTFNLVLLESVVLYFFFLAPILACIYMYDIMNPQLLVKMNVDIAKVMHISIFIYSVLYLIAWVV